MAKVAYKRGTGLHDTHAMTREEKKRELGIISPRRAL